MKKCLILLVVIAFIVTSGMPAMAEDKAIKDYPGKDWFDKPWPIMSGKITLRKRFSGGGELDVDRFINSGQGEAYMKSYALQRLYKDGTEPEVIKYWDDKGIKKVVHIGFRKPAWIAYVPKEAFDENNTKKFPFIFNLPHDNLFECEGRGYAELAAKERLIVVIPAPFNIEEIYRIYNTIVESFPVDTSRFYMTGFSYTGFRTIQFALLHTEVLAGIAVNCHRWPFAWELPEKWIIDHAAELKMPFLQHVGNGDFAQPLPIHSEFTNTSSKFFSSHVHTSQENIDRANMWFRINGVREVTLDESLATRSSKDKVEREIGATVSRSKIAIYDDTEYYIGDFISGDGVHRTRLISMDNIPHTVFGSMAEVTWEFLKHFSRNIETGESLIDGKLPL